jgi:hypothetical protein
MYFCRHFAKPMLYVRTSNGCVTIANVSTKLGVSKKCRNKAGSFARLACLCQLCAPCKCA